MQKFIEKCKLTFNNIQGGDDIDYSKFPPEDRISNSKLKLINPKEDGSVEKFLKGWDNSYSDSLVLGTAIHALFLEEKDHVLSDYTGKPSGKCGYFLDLLCKLRRRNKKLPKEERLSSQELIQKAAEEADYYKSSFTRKRFLSTMKTGLDYYKKLYKGDFYGKEKKIIVLPERLSESTKKCVASLKGNHVIRSLYKSDELEEKEILNEFPLFVEITVTMPNGDTAVVPFKGILDSIVIDHYNKTIHLNDLKTTSQDIDYMMDQVLDDESFNGAFGKGHYYRQFAIYAFLLQMYMDHVRLLSNYDIKCNIIAVETVGSHRAGIFPVNNAYIQEGIKEFKELLVTVVYHKLYGYDRTIEENQ